MSLQDTPPQDVTRLGHLLGPHGVRGAVKLFVLGEPGQIRQLKRVWIEGLGWRRLGGVTVLAPGVALTLAGVETREAAETLRGRQVYAADSELPALPEGEFYYHELRGLSLRGEEGEVLGEVTDVLDLGHQDLLVVRTPAGLEAHLPLQAPYVVVTRRGRQLDLSLQDAPLGLLGEGAEVVPPGRDEDD